MMKMSKRGCRETSLPGAHVIFGTIETEASSGLVAKAEKRLRMADLIGQQFGNYRLTTLLGSGSFAEVYLGEHVRRMYRLR
jgi:hypothetical protein